MIFNFKIKNFKSIVDLNIDFSYGEGKAPNNYKDFPYHVFFNVKNERVVPITAIYGANASGKSNVLKAISKFISVVKLGFNNNLFGEIYCPNKINAKYNTTEFQIKFSVEDSIYVYSIEYNKDSILSENLKLNGKDLLYCKDKVLSYFETKSEIYDDKKINEIYNVECKDAEDNQKFSLLSKIAYSFPNLNKHISNTYKYLTDNLSIYIDEQISFMSGIEMLAKYNDTSKEEQLARITKIIKKLDIDINAITIERKELDLDSPFNHSYELFKAYERGIKANKYILDFVNSYHQDINGNNVIFNFLDESEGTKSLAQILGVVLLTLDRGGVLFVDELEKSLHPVLLLQIIKLFKDKDYNKKNAQLIFTTHNTDILDSELLRVSEVMITNKTNKTGTQINKLSDYPDIRNINNFRKRYLDGEFSGIPYAYI